MKEIDKKDIELLLNKLCCSHCKNEFTSNSIKVKEFDGAVYICELRCEKCSKDFGEILLRYNASQMEKKALDIVEGLPQITYDDVIDAHEFIKKNLK